MQPRRPIPPHRRPTVAPEAAERDTRSHAQRHHDALAAIFRATLGDPTLGHHNGLTVTVIATATIQDLHAHTGHAVEE
ncbi:MAG: DUF222 domain-containing protein [Mycobacterium sp.]